MIDLDQLAMACEWLGMETAICDRGREKLPALLAGRGLTYFEWDGQSENAHVKEVLRVAIMARCPALIGSPAFRIGSAFRHSKVEDFTTSLAAQTVIDMYKAIQGEGA